MLSGKRLIKYFYLLLVFIAVLTITLENKVISTEILNAYHNTVKEQFSNISILDKSAINHKSSLQMLDKKSLLQEDVNARQALLVVDVNIRDEKGNVTTGGWWLVNILAPFFVLSAFLKIVFGILTIPFSSTEGMKLINNGCENFSIMFPGLIVWSIISLSTKGKK